MTVIQPKRIKCAVCNFEDRYYVCSSRFCYGTKAQDLDLRPRNNLGLTEFPSLQKCEHCGYVAFSVDNEPDTRITKDLLQEYQSEANMFASVDAQTFYVRYKIELLVGNYWEAFRYLQCAAWKCDDDALEFAEQLQNDICENTVEKEIFSKWNKSICMNAKLCRDLAINIVQKVLDTVDAELQAKVKLICLDMLRRNGKFEAALAVCQALQFKDKEQNTIICFQRHLAEQRDDKCYSVADAQKWKQAGKDQGTVKSIGIEKLG